jgi:transcriptional regulator with PAS, ATPase and Fis domain
MLKKYLEELSKRELEEQVLELYGRLKEVKTFYDFVFNPKEEKKIDEAKFKISKEYFPPSNRKPKKRRSVAQKHIKEFIKLGMEPALIADLMLYNVEVAQAYNADTEIKQESFYKSMLKSFQEAVKFIDIHGLSAPFNDRLEKISELAFSQDWLNKFAFDDVLDKRKL